MNNSVSWPVFLLMILCGVTFTLIAPLLLYLSNADVMTQVGANLVNRFATLQAVSGIERTPTPLAPRSGEHLSRTSP
jgi:hypothetical protein